MEYFDHTTHKWGTNPKYQEILRLNKMLSEANIPHTLEQNMDGWMVCYPTNRCESDCVMDAIEHFGSYGNGDDKLEIMGLLTPDEEEYDSVAGGLTAEDVFERIRKHYAGEWNAYIKSLTAESTEDISPEISLNIPMSPEKFAAEMRKACEDNLDDEEDRHIVMDDIMCDLLRQLGYGDGIDVFYSVRRWYA